MSSSSSLTSFEMSPDRKASWALIGSPVRSMYAEIFRGTDRARGTPGVEQKSPTPLPGVEKLSTKTLTSHLRKVVGANKYFCQIGPH